MSYIIEFFKAQAYQAIYIMCLALDPEDEPINE